MNVRIAGQSDALVLALLNEPVQDLHAKLYPADFRSDADRATVARFFSGIISDDQNTIGICEVSGSPAGYLWLELRERAGTPFTRSSRRIWIRHLSVLETARRRGVASSLMLWAEDYARALSATELVLDHWADNREAKAFFDKKGFSPVRIVARKQL